MANFNLNIYGSDVRASIPDISEEDLRFVCNRAANLYRSINDPCTDNFRVSRVIDGCHSGAYQDAIDNGCCGSMDKTIVNNTTGNTFIIGFNFGH